MSTLKIPYFDFIIPRLGLSSNNDVKSTARSPEHSRPKKQKLFEILSIRKSFLSPPKSPFYTVKKRAEEKIKHFFGVCLVVRFSQKRQNLDSVLMWCWKSCNEKKFNHHNFASEKIRNINKIKLLNLEEKNLKFELMKKSTFTHFSSKITRAQF